MANFKEHGKLKLLIIVGTRPSLSGRHRPPQGAHLRHRQPHGRTDARASAIPSRRLSIAEREGGKA